MTTAPTSETSQAPRARRMSMRSRNAKYGFAFIAPFIALYLVFVLWPVIQAVWMSLHDWDLLNGNDGFIGLDNYVTMLWGEGLQWNMTHLLVWRVILILGAIAILIPAVKRRRIGGWGIAGILSLLGIAFALGFHPGEGGYWFDPTFWVSLQNTLLFTVISTPLIAGLGLVMALALQGRRRGAAIYQMAFFLPYILPVSVVTLIWAYFLSPNQGLLAELLAPLGIEPVAWLSDPSVAMIAIIVTTTWWTVGFNLVLFAAGLQDVDQSLYEAAALDGAGRWKQFTSVTLPGIQHVLLLVMVMQVIASFQVFGQVNIMTGGGPGTSTMVLIKHVYDSGFRDFDLGYASAVSLFLFAIMLVVSVIQMRFLGKDNTK